MASQTQCTHIGLIQDVTPSGEGCGQCLATDDTWENLRLCLVCGQVGCCDDSKNTHATKHFQSTGHPVMQSFEPDEDWKWCFVDQVPIS